MALDHPSAGMAAYGRRRGFTLIELLTVIAIVGILAALLIPVAGQVRERAHRVKCGSNVRQIVLACQIYAEENGRFPPIEFMRPAGPRGSQTEQSNWILTLANGGYAEAIISIDESPDTIWMCPSAARTRQPAAGNANTYGRNDQTGAWFDETRPADSPDRARAATRTAMIMDGFFNGTVYPTFVNSGAAFPEFVHPPAAVGSTDPDAKINVAFVSGHVETRTRGVDGESRTTDVPVDSDNVFWSGIE